MKLAKSLMWVMTYAAIFYLAAAFVAWEARNPLANRMTFYSHFVDMICFRSLPQFQERMP